MTDSNDIRLVFALYVTRYFVVAAATILVYDHLISLDREVDLIWNKKNWSAIKALFIFNRYFGLLCVILELAVFFNSDLTADFCTFWFYWESISFSLAVLTCELVLIVWVYVIYDRSLYIVSFLLVCFGFEALSVFVLIGSSFRLLSDVQTNLLVLDGINMPYCALNSVPKFMSYYFIPIFAFNLVVLALLLYKGYQFYHAKRRTQNRVILTVYTSSLPSFVGMVSAYLLCCVFWLKAEFALGQVVILAVSLSIISATRLLLSIRHAYFYSHMDRDPFDKTIQIVNLTTIYDLNSSWMYELRELRWKA